MLRVNRSVISSPDALRRYFRSEDFLNEPRTDHIAKLPPTPSYELGTAAGNRLLAVALTYEFDEVKLVDDDGTSPSGISGHQNDFPTPDFSRFPRLSFTRDGRDFKIYPCTAIHQGVYGIPISLYFGQYDLRFEPDDDDGGS